MENITIAEVIKMEDGLPIAKRVSGIIGFIGKVRKSDKYGDSQNILIEDSTGSIFVEVASHEEIKYPEAKGKRASFEGWFEEEKKMWRGLSKTSYEDGDGKTVAKIKCTKTGKMTISETGEKKEEGKPEEPPKQEEPKNDGSKRDVGNSNGNKVPNNYNMTKEEWKEKDLIKDRSIAMSYAVGSFQQDKIKIEDIADFAEAIVHFIYGRKEDCEKSMVKIKIGFGNKSTEGK